MALIIIDTHDNRVVDEVWSLYQYVTHRAGRTINTMIEWDDNIPEWDVLHAELEKAKHAAAVARNYAPLPEFSPDPVQAADNDPVPFHQAQTLMQEAMLRGSIVKGDTATWIRAKRGFMPAKQLAVYARAYRSRLYDVTAEEYPVLKHYLGADAFRQLVQDFVNHTHSGHFNIGNYPTYLPEFFVQHFPRDRFGQELAMMENAISQLYDAEESLPLEPAHFFGMTIENLNEFVLAPRIASRMFAFDYPVNAYYTAAGEDQTPPRPALMETFLVIFRHADEVRRMDLDRNEYRLLRKLFESMPVGAAFDALQSELSPQEELSSTHIFTCFSRWARQGLLRLGD